MAGISAIVSMMIALFVQEPVRGRFMTKVEKDKEAEKKAQAAAEKAQREAAGIKEENGVVAFVKNMIEVFKLPCTRNVLIGGFLRNFAGCIITYYLPVFFGKNYPEMKTTYSLVNAAILSLGGITASLISGILADKLESKSYWSKGIICCIG
jgi:sugar phosphate permease